MEAHARHYPDAIEKHHRLYPQVVDHVQLQAARVEAALTRSQPSKGLTEAELSLDYLQLNSSEPD